MYLGELKLKYLPLNKLFITIYCTTLIILPLYAQGDSSAHYKFLYTVAQLPLTRLPPTAVQLMAVDLEGNTMLFNSRILDGLEGSFSISSEFDKLSARTQSGDLIVFGMDGEIIIEYTFDTTSDEQWNWSIRGWKSPTSLVVTHLTDSDLLFYELDFSNEPPTLHEIVAWNDFLNLDVEQLESWDRCLCELLRFSPDFHYLMSPLLSENRTFEEASSVMMSWDLENEVTTTFTSVFPWWLATNGFPAWSHSETEVVFGIYGDNNLGLYLYNYQSTPQLLYQMCSGCSGSSYSWSLNDRYITIQQGEFSQPNQLILVEVDNGDTRTLISGEYAMGQTYWSPDERYIVFEDFAATSSTLNSLDIETGNVASVFEFNPDLHSTLIGWIRTS